MKLTLTAIFLKVYFITRIKMKLFDVRSDFVAESQISVGHKAFFKTSDKIFFVFVIKLLK